MATHMDVLGEARGGAYLASNEAVAAARLLSPFEGNKVLARAIRDLKKARSSALLAAVDIDSEMQKHHSKMVGNRRTSRRPKRTSRRRK